MPKQEEWDALVATVANQQVMLAEIFERLDALWLGLATGDVVPEITMSEENIEANAITANKINVGTLSAIAANMGVLTAGEIDMYTGTWDSNATGFRLNADEICSQNAGTDQVLLATSTGKLTAGGGDVELGANGIILKQGAGANTLLYWIDTDSKKRAEVMASGTAATEDQVLYLRILESDGSTLAAQARLMQDGANPALFKISSAHLLMDDMNIRFNDANTEIWEDASSNLSGRNWNR